MKHAKLITGVLAGAAVATIAGIMIRRNSDVRKKIIEAKANLENEVHDGYNHGKAMAKSLLRKTMDKANHVKQEHKNSYL